jgi:5-methylthioribose kinase
MVSFDVGMMVSLSYLHLFRMNIKNAKNPVRRNVFSVFMIIAVPTIRAILSEKCKESYSAVMELSHCWPILSIPYIFVNRYKFMKVFK